METLPNEENWKTWTEIQNCPQVSQAEIDAGEAAERQARSNRRINFSKKVGKAALSTVVIMSALGQIQSTYSEARWAPHGASVVIVPGSENSKTDGTANLIFLGFGQYDGSNAAREYYEATGSNKLTAWLSPSSETSTPSDQAPAVEEFIRDNHISELNLVGVSMGTVEALETMRDVVIYDKHNPGRVGDGKLTNGQSNPKVNYLVAYSSPAARDDAFQGDLAHKVVEVADAVGYEGDFAGKMVYSLSVRLSQNPIALIRPDSIPWIIVDSFEDANNPSPPQKAMSDLRTLDDFNIEANAKRYQDVLNPDTKFVYISSPTDGIVNDSESEKGYVDGLEKVGVTDVSSLTTDKDHANTAASAQAFGELLNSEARKTLIPEAGFPFIAAVIPLG